MNATRAGYFAGAAVVLALAWPTVNSLGGCECFFVGDMCVQFWPFCKPAKIEKPKDAPAPCPVPTCDPTTQSCPT